MTEAPAKTYWCSKLGGRWEQIEVHERSVVAHMLSQVDAGVPWEDGPSGYRYKWERVR